MSAPVLAFKYWVLPLRVPLGQYEPFRRLVQNPAFTPLTVYPTTPPEVGVGVGGTGVAVGGTAVAVGEGDPSSMLPPSSLTYCRVLYAVVPSPIFILLVSVSKTSSPWARVGFTEAQSDPVPLLTWMFVILGMTVCMHAQIFWVVSGIIFLFWRSCSGGFFPDSIEYWKQKNPNPQGFHKKAGFCLFDILWVRIFCFPVAAQNGGDGRAA